MTYCVNQLWRFAQPTHIVRKRKLMIPPVLGRGADKEWPVPNDQNYRISNGESLVFQCLLFTTGKLIQTCSAQVLVHEEVGSFSARERFALAFNAERPPADNYHDFNDKDDDNSIDEEQQWKARRAGEWFAATFNQLQKDLLIIMISMETILAMENHQKKTTC